MLKFDRQDRMGGAGTYSWRHQTAMSAAAEPPPDLTLNLVVSALLVFLPLSEGDRVLLSLSLCPPPRAPS